MSHIMGNSSNSQGSPSIPGTQALQRAMAILLAFTDDRHTWTLSALSEELGLTKSTTHRILSALERDGFVSRKAGSAEYQLGPELIVLGARALNSIDLRAMVRPELEALAEATGEDVTLEVLIGFDVLVLDEARGKNLLGLGSSVGTRWPAYATATGKVLLASLPVPLQEPSGGLVAVTAATIVSWEELTETLEAVRKQGYATNIEELEYGFMAVAAPVRDRNGQPVAAISIGGSLHRIGKERIPELVRYSRDAASRVSGRLGFRGVRNKH